MDNFYFTFGYGNPILRNRFLKIKAPTMDAARRIVFDSKVGSSFAFSYSEEEFSGQEVRFGLTQILLGEIP